MKIGVETNKNIVKNVKFIDEWFFEAYFIQKFDLKLKFYVKHI